MRHRIALLALAVILSSIGLSGSRRALAASPVQGLTISPALKNIAIQPGQAEVTFSTTLQNDTSQPLTITPRATDFSSSGVNGAIDLRDRPDAQHGLAPHITFSNPRFTLEPKKSYVLIIVVNGAAALGPGGHFTAIRYQVTPQKPAASLGLQSELLSFLFVSSSGQATYGLKAQWAMPRIVWGTMPHDTGVLFTNTGNTQSAPHGTITISGPPSHRRVAQGVINTNSSLVLPGATRLLQSELSTSRVAFLPGWYSADMYYRSGEGQAYQHIRQRLFFVGWLFVMAAVAAIGLLVVSMYLLRRRKSKKRLPHLAQSGPETVGTKTELKIKKHRRISVKHL